MPNTKLYFAEAIVFDNAVSIRIVTEAASEDLVVQKLKDAFVDRYGPISAYDYNSWEEWEADSYIIIQEIQLNKYWVED